ncbi:MAG: hypothetical protein JRH18_01000 [Deltaproteobacteria bacterium]|nr:hypothetical protein [Deltaproteobacteria bacterium]MBW1994634.1 hypothetical protein [Deltaproteobacteria bacterium]MBW2150225.1 hypothetical protein [Deltaproteobacteria bacterium]
MLPKDCRFYFRSIMVREGKNDFDRFVTEIEQQWGWRCREADKRKNKEKEYEKGET